MTPALGIRGKLFVAAVVLAIAILVPGGLYLEHELRQEIGERIEAELDAHAAAARVAVEQAPLETVPALTAALGQATGKRITVIAADGQVVGDSEVSAAELGALDNHSDRPEVVEAQARGRGTARRHSDTVGDELLYVALPLHRGGTVRVAQSLDAIDAWVSRLRTLLAIAGLIALGAAVLLSALAAQVMADSLRELVANTRTIAETVSRHHHATERAKHLGGLAEEVERMVGTLASERERFKAVLESLSDAVLALDADLTITLMNPAARELLGVAEDAIGRSLLEVVRAPSLQDLLDPNIGPGRSSEFDLPGTQRRVLAVVAPERSGAGFVLVLHDVTTVRRLELIRRDFVANVSHELRTPISIVSANAETLLHGALEDAASAPALVEAIYRNADRLRRIIDDLLDLSRLEAGRFEVEVDEVALALAALRSIDAVASKAEARGTVLASEIASDVTVLADRDALHQVLVNLLDNAIKYSQEGARVTLLGRRDGERVRLEVRDDGPGIAPAHRDRIFERFYRIDPGRSRDMGGTGLGLSIVKHMLEAMGGKIGVTANHPRGTIFWIELPAPPIS